MVGEWQQGPTPNPSPKGRGVAARSAKGKKTIFSRLENIVFSAGKRCFHGGEQVLDSAATSPARSRSPPYGEGLGVGLVLLPPPTMLPPPLK